jgi:hypothetical protein
LPVVLTVSYVGLYNKNPHGLGLTAPVSEATQGIYGGTPIVVLGGASSVGQIGTCLFINAPLDLYLPLVDSSNSVGKAFGFLTDYNHCLAQTHRKPEEFGSNSCFRS